MRILTLDDSRWQPTIYVEGTEWPATGTPGPRPPVTGLGQLRVEKQWRYEGRWRLSVYYYVGNGLQHYRVYDADQCRPVGSAHPI